mmetsp:Transcript_107513/g.195568  ORF Transcript_107513/g.195568 Transcript_107513/m.195568 type:complete len:438 (-) Transcript_107513:81-1394(-)
MGWGRGGRGKGKARRGDSDSSKAHWQNSQHEVESEERWDEWGWDDESWNAGGYANGYGDGYGTGGAHGRRGKNHTQSVAWAQPSFARPLAAQWRFVCRVLHRHAPEERVHDARRQLRLGDHVFARYAWDFTEQHGIICSSFGEENHGRRRDREDSQWVVHWLEDLSRIQCTSLSQFSKGGELFRMSYPHWVCQVYLPTATTMKPHIADERYLEADSEEAVAKRANNAHRNGHWSPHWNQATDIEFCIEMKTGTKPMLEVHARKTLTSTYLAPLGYAIGGERPSRLFGIGRSSSVSSGAVNAAAPPGFAANQWSHTTAVPNQGALTVTELEAGLYKPPDFSQQAYGQAGLWPAAAGWNSWEQSQAMASPPPATPAPSAVQAAPRQPIAQLQMASLLPPPQMAPQHADQASSAGAGNKQLSANAQVFVPRSSNWDGIYQ